jgi:hypothetical protein
MAEPVQSILFVFPEGNITNNPNMLSLVLLLSQYYKIYIVTENDKQNNLNIHIYHYFLKELSTNKVFKNNKKILDKNISDVTFSLIIGIDQGIKFADYIAKEHNTPLALISYEIFFRNEWDSSLKQQEINACKNIVFAICQDSMRAYLLSKENNIPIEKIINVPISETYNDTYNRSTYLYEKLEIPYNKKILLYIGSFGTWAMTEELIDSTKLWPEDWVLVLHPRYGIDNSIIPFLEQINNNPKVYLSSESKNHTYELEDIICSANLGLVLYDIDTSSHYTGKNILFVGLSSGKFSCFIKYRTPVVVNNNTNIADIISKYNLGYVVSNVNDIGLLLSDNNACFLYENCDAFFKKYLDFAIYKPLILSIIEKTIKKENVIGIICKNNNLIDIKNNKDIRMEIIYDKLLNNINSLNSYKNNLLRNRLRKILKTKVNKYYQLFKNKILLNKQIWTNNKHNKGNIIPHPPPPPIINKIYFNIILQ